MANMLRRAAALALLVLPKGVASKTAVQSDGCAGRHDACDDAFDEGQEDGALLQTQRQRAASEGKGRMAQAAPDAPVLVAPEDAPEVGATDGFGMPADWAGKASGNEVDNDFPRSNRLTIGMGGDAMPSSRMMTSAFKVSDAYQSLVGSDVSAAMLKADLFFVNHETAGAQCVDIEWNDRRGPKGGCPRKVGDVYSFSGWSINNHPDFSRDLAAIGVDVVALANNHIMDRGALGLDRTVEGVEKAGLQYAGAHRQSDERSWYTISETKGWKIAWVACGSHLTDRKVDFTDQVLFCNSTELLPLVTELDARADVDAVMVSVHWGRSNHVNVYQTKITDTMKTFARSLIDAGAVAVIGSHQHVVNGWEKYGRGAIFYSLGNFIASQSASNFCVTRCVELHEDEQRSRKDCKRLLASSIVGFIDLDKTAGAVQFKDFRYLVTTWNDMEDRMEVVAEQMAQASWAVEALGEVGRLSGPPGRWKRTGYSMFCVPDWGSKDLGEVTSVVQCGHRAEQNPMCGPEISTNGRACRCVTQGDWCKWAWDPAGLFHVYQYEAEPKGSWVKAYSNKKCVPVVHKRLPEVDTEEECMQRAHEEPNCGGYAWTTRRQFGGGKMRCSCSRVGTRCLAMPSRSSDVFRWHPHTGKWNMIRRNMYCGDQGLVKLSDSVVAPEACGLLARAKSECGNLMITNGERCRCVEREATCAYMRSSLGFNVYEWQS